MYHNDRDESVSSKKREEIENEVRSYVIHFARCATFCISLGCLRVMVKDQMGPGSADSIFVLFRILKAGEKRASDLLKEKEAELHRVSDLFFPPPFV